MHEHVQAGEVAGAEDGGARPPHRLAQDGVDLVEAVAHLQRAPQRHHEAIDADAIGDEVGRIFAQHHALAQAVRAEGPPEIHDLGRGVVVGHQLQQLHVTHGIEEVRDQETAPKILRQPGGHGVDGDAAGIGGDDRIGREQGGQAREEGALGLELLDYGLDHDVTVPHLLQIVLDVADVDQPRAALVVEQGRRGAEGAI